MARLLRFVCDVFTPGLSDSERADCLRRFPRIISQLQRGCWSKGEASRLYRRLSGGEFGV